jgi:hypothetical protein
MLSDELYDIFRSDVVDFARPYLWSDDEVWRYMNEAYFTFVRLTGGIADFTSDATAVPIVAGQSIAALDPSILRIMKAYRASDGVAINIINSTDLPMHDDNDYGRSRPVWMDTTPGTVRYMMIGMQANTCQWFQTPIIDDTANLFIYRLPFIKITGAAQPFTDVGEEHHYSLLLGMKALAYRKQDAETFDRAKAAENDSLFRAYCAQVRAEFERKKHKPRSVAYGGL